MKFEKIYNKGQSQLFRYSFLEFFTKSHPLIIWGMYLPLAVWMIYYASAYERLKTGTLILIFFAGLFFWTFFEYVVHRFVFHWVSDRPGMQKFTYIIHGNHHHYPRDKQRLLMPPLPSVIISSSIFGLMYLSMKVYAFVFFPGFIVGYLLYGTMHYAIHSWPPPAKWLKPLWRNHHFHHYDSDEKGFGVSSVLWDWVFGTMSEKSKKVSKAADRPV